MIGEVFMVGGWMLAAALLVRGRSQPEPEPPERTSADCICGCEHHLAFHDAEHGCQQQLVVYQDVAGVKGVQIAARLVACRCVKYVGPEPLSEVIP